MSLIDKIIKSVSPKAALNRAEARLRLDAIARAHEISTEAFNIQARGYSDHGASRSKPSLSGFNSTPGSPDEDITDNLEILRSRSRSLHMGSPLARSAISTVRTNVIGGGLRLNSQIDFGFLGLTEEQADAWESNTEREFALWADNHDCDAARMLTFGQLQNLALTSALMNGDDLAALKVKPIKGRAYDLRIELIEGDRLINPQDTGGKNIVGGVELDDDGAVAAFHIAKNHPHASYRVGHTFSRETVRVPAFGELTGRRNVLHLMQDMERIGQRRGVPLLAPVIEQLKQITRYHDAELTAAVINSMFTVFVTSEAPQAGFGNIGISDPAGGAGGYNDFMDSNAADEYDDDVYNLGSGTVVHMNKGEGITTANPGRPNTAFDGFVLSMSRQIGAALELPVELLNKQFTTSYSAARAALLEAWKMFRMRRVWMVQNFCQPIYEEWLAEAVAKGRIKAPGFFADPAVRAAWSGAEWYGPSQGQIDPLKEVNAASKRVNEGFSTRERETAELTGMSFDRTHAARAREEQKRRADGLAVPLLDPTAPQPAPTKQQQEADE